MLSRKHLVVALALVLLAALASTLGTASHAQKRGNALPSPTPSSPVVTIQSDMISDNAAVTICPGDESTARLQLRAIVRSPDGSPMTVNTYEWRVSGGTIEKNGANATWDLTGVRPGVPYKATVEVNTGTPQNECWGDGTFTIAVANCPPPRIICPNVSIYCPDTVALGAPLTFKADISGGTEGITQTLNWTVSAGTISSGQGTSTITVDTAGLGGRPVTATVEVLGYNRSCKATCTTQTFTENQAKMCDSYPLIRFNDEKARLDNCNLRFRDEQGAEFYIVVYGNRAESLARGARAKRYLVYERGVTAERVHVLEGSQTEELHTELWLVPTGAKPPQPRM